MFGWGPATRIYLAAGAADMRKGFEGLYGLVRDRLLCEPLSGHLFLLGRNRTLGVRETITERVLQALASVPPGSAAERAASICFRISSNSGRDCC